MNPNLYLSGITYGDRPMGSKSNTTNVKVANANTTTEKVKMLEKKHLMYTQWEKDTEIFKEKADEVQKNLIKEVESLNRVKKENEELKKRYEEVKKNNEEMQQKTQRNQRQHYDRSKNIKVTDDDFSTIIAKLGKFSGKLSNFPPNSKSCFKKNLPREELIQFFIKHNGENEPTIRELFNQDEDRIDYALVSVLVEKFITDEIVKEIYKASIHLDSKINEAFKEIKDLLRSTGHEKWISDFRLKISKATYDSIYNYKVIKRININNSKRKSIIDHIVEELSNIYEKPDDIRARVEKLVDMAVELSLPIRGQEDLVQIIDLKAGEKVYKSQVKPMYRQFDGTEIKLGISPVFLAKSTVDDENQSGNEDEEGHITHTYLRDHTLVYPGKAIY